MARVDPRVIELIVTLVEKPGSDALRVRQRRFESGSGYLLTPLLVLTAGHVVDGEDCWDVELIEVRPVGGSQLIKSSVCWRASSSDVALLRLDQVAMVPTAAVSVRWGGLGNSARVACRAVGFPRSTAGRRTIDGRPVREPEPIEGLLAPGVAAKSRASADMHVFGAVPAEAESGDSLWRGLSGAAVFVGPWLVGVVSEQPKNFGANRLAVELIEDVVAGKGFAPYAGLASVEPADLPLWLQAPYEALAARLRHSAQILRPRYGLVPFRNRPELAKLLDWCGAADGYAVALVTAGGGQGKTRLAAELCARMTEQGWLAGFMDKETPLDFESLGGGGVLVVIDYADSRNERVLKVIEACRRIPAPVRVLLLARHAGYWWKALPDQLERNPDLVSSVSPRVLDVVMGTAQHRADEFTRAARALAVYFGMDPLQVPPAPTELGREEFANTFLVQLAALTHMDPPAEGMLSADLLDAALRREDHKHWLPLAEQLHLSAYLAAEPQRREDLIAVATLTTPSNSERAAELLRVLPELAEQTIAARRDVSTWLRAAYPADNDRNAIGALEPDLLGEHLVTRFVARSEETGLLHDLYTRATQTERNRLLRVLSRAARSSTIVERALNDLYKIEFMHGTVTKVVPDRGFGFVRANDGNEFFMHFHGLGVAMEDFPVGQSVLFRITESDKGPRITEIYKAKTPMRIRRTGAKLEGDQH